ncbi:hypothetical protein FQR65_LT11867 [Abscondita terminalis]|nr:hypothetical protein FQR65_LT11867 [Abscondita terminalis]
MLLRNTLYMFFPRDPNILWYVMATNSVNREDGDILLMSQFGKCVSVSVDMVDELHHRNLLYQFYFNNLFTTFNPLAHLKEMGYGDTGTTRINKIPNEYPLMNKRQLQQIIYRVKIE